MTLDTSEAENTSESSASSSPAEAESNVKEKEAENTSGTSACSNCCPFARLSPKEWHRLVQPPFRKRHPIVFWSLAIIAAIAVFTFFSGLFSKNDSSPTGDCIALINIQGPILDSAETLAWIRKIEKTGHVKGCLVRINSPGGGVGASHEIYSAIKRLGKKMPVVASMGATAASGGLMVSMGAQKIYTGPSTITGSIGVRMDIPQVQGLLEKIGVGQETLTTAPYKDAASYLHPLTPADRKYLEGVLMNMHDQFVAIIAENRKMPIEKARELANGKVYTGQEAVTLGLADELGGQEEAQAWVASQAKVSPAAKLYTKPVNRMRMIDLVLGSIKFMALLSEGHSLGEILAICGQPAFLY